MQSAERQKPRNLRRTSIEDDLSNVPRHDIMQEAQSDGHDSLFQEFQLEPFDYTDILDDMPTSQQSTEPQLQQPHGHVTKEILNTCMALDYSCLYLLDAFTVQHSSLTSEHDLSSCHKMLSELISAQGTTSSSLHSEILESIKLQLQNVLPSKDAQKLVEHIVIIANHVYKIVQTARQRPSELDTTQFTNQDTDEAMLIVQRIVEDLQSMRANNNQASDDNDIWEQIDSSIMVVEHLIDTILCDSQLPHYNDACGPRAEVTGLLPPYYNNASTKTKDPFDTDDSKRTYDLDGLISALDRITTSVPRLNDQCFELSERQRRQMDAATMRATVDRLARGRLDNQRANTPKHRTKPTNDIVPSNFTAEERTSEKLVDCQARSSQNCKYPEQMFMALMRRWVHSILTYGERRRDRHRRKTKAERDRYTLDLISRFERLREKTRLHNQDAVMMLCYHELDQILVHLDKTKNQFTNQRASFRSRPAAPATTS